MDVKKSGWILSESGLNLLQVNSDTKSTVKILLNKDLREIGAGCSDLFKGKLENIEYEQENIVLQLMKIRNVSAPKANENSKTAPKLLRLSLTDGKDNYSALEIEPTSLSLENTPPGTKISLKVKQLKIANGYLLLSPKNMDILGGNVESLVSKWEISRSLANQMKGNLRSGGAPPFIPFGQKIQQNITNDKSFKSLHSKQKENEENSEFITQRQDAIAEASKVSARKTFGGGTKTLVDTNVQKIIDKGFTEEQATTALKFARNNVEKALSNLKRREERQQQRGSSIDYDSRENQNPRERRGERDNRGNSKSAASSDLPPSKPSTGVSLFDFLENKIPESSTAKQSYFHQNERFENNISSSFRKYDKDSSDKSHHQFYTTPREQKSSQNFNKSSAHSNSSRSDYYGNEGSSTREHRDYKGNSNYRGERSERDVKQQYNQKQGGNNNYPTKTNSAASSTHYSKNNLTPHQKSNSHNNYNNGASSYNNNNNFGGQGKYGQKSVDQNSIRSSKDYNNSYSSSAASSSYHSKGRSPNANDGYHSKSSRNIVDSMEKMNLKENQHYKGYDQHAPSASESKHQSYSANYPTIGFQNKEGNEQAKTALKTKNFPVSNQAPNWQQQQSIPPFQNAVQPFVQHPVMAMQTATVFQPITYPPIIMQTVPTSHMQAPPAVSIPQLKINDFCLAKYWEDGKFYNAKITGVSESTFVVHFTEYGNAEEVRKTDCAPICPTQPQPQHSYHQIATPVVPSHMGSYRVPPKIEQHNYHGQQSMAYKGGPKRRN